jgi:5-methylcytosine-specific restriction endonuclease McrA
VEFDSVLLRFLKAETLRVLSGRLGRYANLHLLGPHSLLIPREVASAWVSEAFGGGLERSRAVNTEELRVIVTMALDIDLENWHRDIRSPDPARWPKHWRGIDKDGLRRPDIWIENGWDICPQCFTVQTQCIPFIIHEGRRVEVAGAFACHKCVDSFQFQTSDSVRQWLREWYANRASEIRAGIIYKPHSAVGNGEHAHQLSTFEWTIAGNYIKKLFDYRCAYCGKSLGDRKHPAYSVFDHGIARSCRGHDVAENIVLSCYECNHSKGKKSISEYYSYRRKRKIVLYEEGLSIALEVERRYHSTYAQLSDSEVLKIKRPVAELLPIIEVGRDYLYEPVDFEKGLADFPKPRTVVLIERVLKGSFYCTIIEHHTSRKHDVFIVSLKKM